MLRVSRLDFVPESDFQVFTLDTDDWPVRRSLRILTSIMSDIKNVYLCYRLNEEN